MKSPATAGVPTLALTILALAALLFACGSPPAPLATAPAPAEAAPAAVPPGDEGYADTLDEWTDAPPLPLVEKPEGWTSPVERHGKLSVKGTQLVDAGGKPVILRGVSTSNLAVFEQFVTEDAIAELAYEWKIDVLRLAVFTHPFNGGYVANTRIGDIAIEAARLCGRYGVYCIIDWHILNDASPMDYLDHAKEFFAAASAEFEDAPHVLYEVCNEPHGPAVTWKGVIKPYAEQVLPLIRANAPEAIVIVGTPDWSHDVDVAAEDPIADPRVMYTFHFYCADAGKYLMDKLARATKKIPVFVTEWGGTNSDGGRDGVVYKKEARTWIDYIESLGLSWCTWQFSDAVGESSALIDVDAPVAGKRFYERLSEYGRFMLEELRKPR